MEPWKTITNIAMKQPNVQTMLLMKVESLEVEPKGWGNNAMKVTLTYL